MKMMIYAKDPQELPFHTGEAVENLFTDIVDSYYRGALALKNLQFKKIIAM